MRGVIPPLLHMPALRGAERSDSGRLRVFERGVVRIRDEVKGGGGSCILRCFTICIQVTHKYAPCSLQR